ncbi:MAG: hypothetical protein AAB466_03700 [Verrucomicrobiota bacterium]
MNWLSTIALLMAAYLSVFAEAFCSGVRQMLGAQIDLLPALMVYVGLSGGLTVLTLLAVLGGLCFDAFSANPLGISVLPLFTTGLLIYCNRELILRDQPYAQFVLGLGASAVVPFLTVLSLLGAGEQPLLGWGSLWQWLVMASGGAVLTPVCFNVFDRFNRALTYPVAAESTFRADREIKRGRS